MTRAQVLLIVSLLLLLSPAVILGQQASSVTGVVTDASGAPIAGAGVKLTDTQTGFVQSTNTNDLGVYLLVEVKPGLGYSLVFTATGFQTLEMTGVTLGVGITETRNATLQVGSVSDTVVVEAKGETTLNTTDATIGNVIGTRSMVDLPV